MSALSPLLSLMRDELPLNDLEIGLIGSLPTLCFGIFGLATLRFIRVRSLTWAIALALSIIVVGQVVRAAAQGFVGLFIASTVVFGAIGVANVLLPSAIKHYYPTKLTFVTSLTSTGMTLFAALPGLLAVPMAHAFGWRISLGSWSLLGVVALFPWVYLAWCRRPALDKDAFSPKPQFEDTRPYARDFGLSRTAWVLMTLFASTSALIFGIFAWLPRILSEHAGLGDVESGALLALFSCFGVVASLIVPSRAKAGQYRSLVILAGIIPVCGFAGLLIVPNILPVLWVICIGFCWVCFPLVLLLISQLAPSGEGALKLSAFTQGGGYLLSALLPAAVGAMLPITGSWHLPLVLFAVMPPLALISGLKVRRLALNYE